VRRQCTSCLVRLERGGLGIFPFLRCRRQIDLWLEFPNPLEFHLVYLVVLFSHEVSNSEQRGYCCDE
jgi:hypothetical protein